MSDSALTRTEQAVERIRADRRLRSCIAVRSEAFLEAAEVDLAKPGAPLAGWTIGVKDNIDVAGTVRTDGLGPPYPAPASADSPAVARLRAAGAVIVAKTNLEQLSFGATTRTPPGAPAVTRGIRSGSLEAPAAGPPRRSRPASSTRRLAPTPAAHCVTPLRSAG